MVKLDEIIEELDPDKIYGKVGKKHEEARVKYKVEKIRAEDWEDFKKQIIDYVKHHQKALYGVDMDDHRAYSLAVGILSRKKEEGGFGGLEAALSAGKKSLRTVFDSIAESFQSEEENAYRLNVIHKVDPHDFDAHVELMTEYMSRYEPMLPKGLKKRKPAELAKDYTTLLQAYAAETHAHRGQLKAYEPKKKAA